MPILMFVRTHAQAPHLRCEEGDNSFFRSRFESKAAVLPPLPVTEGERGPDHLTNFERTNKGKSFGDGDSSFARIMAWTVGRAGGVANERSISFRERS